MCVCEMYSVYYVKSWHCHGNLCSCITYTTHRVLPPRDHYIIILYQHMSVCNYMYV